MSSLRQRITRPFRDDDDGDNHILDQQEQEELISKLRIENAQSDVQVIRATQVVVVLSAIAHFFFLFTTAPALTLLVLLIHVNLLLHIHHVAQVSYQLTYALSLVAPTLYLFLGSPVAWWCFTPVVVFIVQSIQDGIDRGTESIAALESMKYHALAGLSSFRKTAARVYHLGGIHSGTASSAVVWLILLAVQATRERVNNRGTSTATVVLTYIILFLLVGIVLFAYPALRIKRHDAFERVHRFLGWTATALVWAQVVLLTNDYKGDKSLGSALVHLAAFWLMIILSLSLILPWTHLRKVPVNSVVLSNHAVQLFVDYGPHPVPGSFQRFSTDPLNEWHSFATIAVPGKPGFSIIISQAGDWTTEMITNPPKEIYVRGMPTCGALRIVPLFRRVLFVATGSGIAPFMPHIMSGKVDHKLFWMAPNTRATFGDPLVNSVLENSPGAVVYDTRKHGKPDIIKITNRFVDEFQPECVCVISNQKLTEKVIYGLRSRGILAFGAIFDS
ncbi:uncharacterized protein EV420DRAFT_1760335 [Desarmillaria tabescens]|uniref:Non-ribosomal peptide synthetase n=1 Tax=Armillaria tabescens TaxID=1929756 RepID=A0AA39NER7_ARMTA|nr:uncharacterized protein EV420DRAFT_1760335 [Desarmillaria tabescens]KAK0464282.1 hypothetical protein EV420DRAFT_1760335 [Desarmillaria tabescens]